MKVIIVDEQPYRRRVLAEALRGIGVARIERAESVDECFALICGGPPDLIIADWRLSGGLSLVRQLRTGRGGEDARATPVVMVAEQARARDVAAARDGGVDLFLLRPFSMSALSSRVKMLREAKREFVDSPLYVGPCRRRRRDDAYRGPRRRLVDPIATGADIEDVQIRKGMVQLYARQLRALSTQLSDATHVRQLAMTCGQLDLIVETMADEPLRSAVFSLYRYVKSGGLNARPEVDVLMLHLDAIERLADLPDAEVELRSSVAAELRALAGRRLRSLSGSPPKAR